MKFKSEFLKEIQSRGFIYQSSDIEQLDDLINKKKIFLLNQEIMCALYCTYFQTSGNYPQ